MAESKAWCCPICGADLRVVVSNGYPDLTVDTGFVCGAVISQHTDDDPSKFRWIHKCTREPKQLTLEESI